MPPPARRVPFVGRERELGILLARLDEARSGDGGVALVAGEPGIGKTRLLAEFTARARHLGCTALGGRAYETAGMPPYLPFSEALREYLRGRSATELRAVLEAGAAEVARLVPQLRELLPDLMEPPAVGSEQERYRLFEGVSAALLGIARASESGLLLVLDDLHWADASSLALLRHLADKLSDAPLYVALGYRTIDPTIAAPVQEALAAINRADIATFLPLSGFNTSETATLLSGLTGKQPAPQVSAAVHAATEGSPFFVSELARHLESEGRDLSDPALADAPLGVPDGVRHVVGMRLTRLTPAANRALQVATVLNDGFSFEVLQRASGLEATVVLDVIDEALAAGMIREDGSGFAFAHALIRQTLYDRQSLPRRQQLHLRAGEAIEATYAGRLADHAAELAEHFAHSSSAADLAKAVAYGELAAQRALAVYAYGEAVALLRKALVVEDALDPTDSAHRCDLLLELCNALVPAGDHRRVLEELLPEAYELAEVAGDHERAAHVADRGVAAGIRLRGFKENMTSEARAVWVRRLDQHALAGTHERLHADLWLAEFLRTEQRFGEASRRLIGIIEEARERGDLESLYLALEVGLWSPVPSTWADTRRLALECAHLSRSGVDPLLLPGAMSQLVFRLLDGGERLQAEAILAELGTLIERTGDPYGRLCLLVNQARIAVVDGRLTDAQRLVEQASELGHQWDLEGVSGWYVPMLSRSLLLTGRVETALANAQSEWGHLRARSTVALAYGSPLQVREARRRLEQLPDSEELAERAVVADHVLFLEVAVELGDGARAADLAREVELIAGSCMGMAPMVLPARLLGKAAALNGDHQRARSFYQQALEAAGAIGFRPEIALTRLAVAELLVAGESHERPEALDHVAFVIPEFEAMDMKPALERARSLQDQLAAAQGKAGVAAYPAGLTEREVEVLRLVAAGKTNGEIDEKLVISMRTVERHISTIYGKIGASGPTARVAAAAYARHHGLEVPGGLRPPS